MNSETVIVCFDMKPSIKTAIYSQCADCGIDIWASAGGQYALLAEPCSTTCCLKCARVRLSINSELGILPEWIGAVLGMVKKAHSELDELAERQ